MSSFTPRSGNCLWLPLLFFVLPTTVYTQPTAIVSSNAPLCAGAPALLLSESGSGAVTWHWNGPGGFSSTIQNPVIPNPGTPAAGNYYVTVTDINGLTATGSVHVSVHGSEAMACNDLVVVSPGPDHYALILPETILEGSYDYAFYSVEVFNAAGAPLGDTLGCDLAGQILTYEVTDNCSGASCGGFLKVEDKSPPLIKCTDIFYSCAIQDYSPDYLRDVLGLAEGYPMVSDNCTDFTLSHVDQFFNLPCALPLNGLAISSAWHRREWRATDAAGNTASCAQIIYFVRRHLSDVHLPADTVVNCKNPLTDPVFTGAPYITEYGHNFTLFPNNAYCEMNAGYSDVVVEVCDGTWKIRRTWTIFEDCAITGEPEYIVYDQLIKVEDTKDPAFTCPADLIVSLDPFTCCAQTDLPDVVMTDNCSRISKFEAVVQAFDVWTNDSIGTYGLTGALTTFPDNNLWLPDTLGQMGITPCIPQGKHVVTYIATDDCGNSKTCSFSLKIKDDVPPVVSCDTYTKVALGIDGTAEVFATTFDDGTYDFCCNTQLLVHKNNGSCFVANTHFNPSVKFCCKDIGDTIKVTMRATDCSGNTSDCLVNVLVEDKIRPQCIAPANLTIDCAGFDPTLGSFGLPHATDNCCVDTILSSVNYNQFDSICNRGTIIRNFKAFDCYGNSNQCSQRIVVDYQQYFYLKMPDDKIVNTCDGTGDYGEPTIHFEDCELIGISYEDEVFTVVPEGCYRIDRHWKIINWCTYNPSGACVEIPNPDISQQRPFILPGPVISPVNTQFPWAPTITFVSPSDPAPTNYSIFWDASANCYEYKQMILVFDTKDPIIENCPQNPVQVCDVTANSPAIWHDLPWWDAHTASHDLCEGPTDLSITAYDACTGADIRFRYLLFLDLNGDGVMESVVNSNNPPPPGMVNYNNALTPNFSGGEFRVFDNRSVPLNQKYNFSIHETVVGNKRQASLRWKTGVQLPFPGNPFGQPGIVPELPYGRHKIKWLVEDGCTNESFCEYNFEVKDCKKPTVVCLSDPSVNIPASTEVELWVSDFLQYAEDNCTPNALLKLGIRKAGTGIGFPLDAHGNPVQSLVFSCADIGVQTIEIWAMDLAGNADYCEAELVVQDNFGMCGTSGQVSGALRTENENGVEAANVDIAGSSSFAPAFTFDDATDNTGNYVFGAIPLPSDFTITPTKDDNPLNGVTTIDLVDINKHILGIKPLDSPYKMIAADANHSNSVTSSDVIELRKLILGIYTDLPSNTSWRFVDKAFEFPNPTNPFQTVFPENITVLDAAVSQSDADFVAVKIGDVNGTAIANTAATVQNRDKSNAKTLFSVNASVLDAVKAGDLLDIVIGNEEPLVAYQFSLQFKGLEVLEIMPGANQKADEFALSPAKNMLSVACDQEGRSTFVVKCKALSNGYLHQMIAISEHATAPLAYSSGMEGMAHPRRPVLQFPAPKAFEVYSVQPNPFGNTTSIGFSLPQASGVSLQITDEQGHEIWAQHRDFQAGFNVFDLDFQHIGVYGVLFFKMSTSFGAIAGKMIRM